MTQKMSKMQKVLLVVCGVLGVVGSVFYISLPDVCKYEQASDQTALMKDTKTYLEYLTESKIPRSSKNYPLFGSVLLKHIPIGTEMSKATEVLVRSGFRVTETLPGMTDDPNEIGSMEKSALLRNPQVDDFTYYFKTTCWFGITESNGYFARIGSKDGIIVFVIGSVGGFYI